MLETHGTCEVLDKKTDTFFLTNIFGAIPGQFIFCHGTFNLPISLKTLFYCEHLADLLFGNNRRMERSRSD